MDIGENHRTPLLAEAHNNVGAMPMEPKMKAILRSEGEEVVLDINEVSCSNENGHDIDNPLAFLGFSDDFNVPASSIDPFRNHTPNISGVYEWIKTVICVPLALVRVLVFGVVLSIGFSACKLALIGWRNRQSPMPKWRGALMWVARISARCVLFCFGYHWIRRIGKPASRRIAPIVVCNHVSYTDPLFFFYELFPSIVASETHDKIPVVGTIIRTTQVIYVDRSSPESRKHAVAEIKRKASCNDFPRVMLFPEGTTTNGKALISFQPGAFVPGFPVQPVVIRYPHVHFDPSWGKISLSKLIFRMLTQFHNFMEVEYLPVIFPTESKMGDPTFYAKKGRWPFEGRCYTWSGSSILTNLVKVIHKGVVFAFSLSILLLSAIYLLFLLVYLLHLLTFSCCGRYSGRYWSSGCSKRPQNSLVAQLLDVKLVFNLFLPYTSIPGWICYGKGN